MKLSKEQIDIIDAPLGPIAVTACAGSGKTATAIRRLIAIRQKMQNSRARWPKGEWIIANYLEIHPSEIWPSRYFDKHGQLIERKFRNKS
ncbi:helix-turn-helix domain-containing protein [Photorhabdus australis]|uniref:helix-turn-helix domain-containing protein n=1 Tax=Photorhabdus australis TaxID=286156 RepID=UPI000560819E|nr:helix-turn-helix domain-containing protein [Photorhabdus australis]